MKNHSNKLIPLAFIIITVIWHLAYYGFYSKELQLTGDAAPYLGQFKYFIDQMLRGEYPLWDPLRGSGIPNEFYLRRIGSYNPLILVLVILFKIGVPFYTAYMSFLSLYYLLCIIGFYYLASQIFQDKRLGFLAAVILMFSSASTLLFDSFLIFSYTPMVWFFVFLFKLVSPRSSEDRETKTVDRGQKYFSFLGLIFTLMLIVTTYVPFYFLHQFLTFLLFFSLFYWKALPKIVNILGAFVKENKFLCLAGSCALIIALIPGILFYFEGQQGEIAMPIRHKDSSSPNVFEVGAQTFVDGGIMAPTIVGDLFFNYPDFMVGKFYVPFMLHIFLGLGVLVALNKRITFLSVWGFAIFLTGLYGASPVYKYLYNHIFYFKLMRNFQYFLWHNTLPVIILIGIEHLRLFLRMLDSKQQKMKWLIIILVIFIHILIAVVLSRFDQVANSTYLTIFLSLIYFMFLIKNGSVWGCNKTYPFILLTLLIIAQPLEITQHIQKQCVKK